MINSTLDFKLNLISYIAYTASLAEPKIKFTVLFNSGYIDRSASTLKTLKSLKNPVAYFLGDVTGESCYYLA